MPKWLTLLALVASVPLRGIEISGSTAAGMAFSGKVVAMDGERLLIRESPPDGPLVGIAVKDIGHLRLPSATTPLQELEPLAPLMHLLDEDARQRIMEVLASWAETGDWATVYTWTGHLLNKPGSSSTDTALPLLRMEALLAMGFHDQAREAAFALASRTDRLNAPPRLCRIMALVLEREGDPAGALDWARLPSVQLPMCRGPLSRELAELCQRLEEQIH